MNLVVSKVSPLFTVFTLIFLLSGCSQTVTRVDSDSVTDLSGNWNDTDSRLVAEEMIQDVEDEPMYQGGIAVVFVIIIIGVILLVRRRRNDEDEYEQQQNW